MKGRFAGWSIIFLLLLITTCSTNTGIGVDDQLQDGYDATGSELTGTTQFAVRMNPQEPVDPAFKRVSSLLNPGELPVFPVADRICSEADDVISRAASSYTATLPSGNVRGIGDYLEFSPDWDPQATSSGELAYCIYEFNYTSYPEAPTCTFHWNANYAPASDQDFYLGLSDWDNECWIWFDGPEDNTVTFESYERYTTEEGRMLAVVVLLGTERCLLEMVSLGTPEIRSTGDVDDDRPVTETPPLYIPELPSSVDLSGECAPVNDQLSWGSCTAFAVGDGAYNYELGQIYGGLGWDLTNSFNRVSPKYLYVTSGEYGGWPPSGEIGRMTDNVAEVLRLYGVATEQNAPYDLVYDNDWSADALADAELLKIENWWGIPCWTDAGINSLKTVLANSRRTIFMRVNLDYSFFYYEPDTVWNYTGPSYGGHAMCIVGYDDARNAFKVRNSWSEDWGNDGYLWIHYATFKSYGAAAGCWTLNDDYDPAVAQRFLGTQALLAPPTGLIANQGDSADGIDLTWDAVDGAIGYRIYRDLKTTEIAELGSVTSYTDEGISDEYSHVYWIKAFSETEESYYSSPAIGYKAQPPAIAGISPGGGSQGQVVEFIATVYGSGTMSYSWDFDGGATPNTSTEDTPLVTLGEEGSYEVTLTVTNELGSDTFYQDITIGPNLPPVAEIVADQTEGFTPLTVNFDASGSYDPDGSIVLYTWRCERDGGWEVETTEPNLTRELVEPAQHDVFLIVTDDSGNQDAAPWGVVVHPENYVPFARYSYHIEDPVVPFTVTFNASSSYDLDGDVVMYRWDYDGDGTYDESGSSLINTSHIYTEMGRYSPVLQVEDDDGATDQTSWTFDLGVYGFEEGWEVYSIDYRSSSYLGYYATLVNDKPVIMVLDSEGGAHYYYPNSSSPTAATDWTLEEVDLASPVYNCALADVGTDAAIIFQVTGGIAFARRNEGSWIEHSIFTSEVGSPGGNFGLSVINDSIVAMYNWSNAAQDDKDAWYARATTDPPASAADWVTMRIADGLEPRSDYSIMEYDGKPMVAFLNRNISIPVPSLAVASVADPTTIADWSWYEINSSANVFMNVPSLFVVNGYPAVVVGIRNGVNGVDLYKALNGAPSQAADWDRHSIDVESNPGDPYPAELGGYPAVLYARSSELMLAEATTTDPGDIYGWTRTRIGPDLDLHAFFVIDGKPVIIASEGDVSVLYYIYQTD